MVKVEEPKKLEWREVADLLYAVTVPGGTIYTYSGHMIFVPFMQAPPVPLTGMGPLPPAYPPFPTW